MRLKILCLIFHCVFGYSYSQMTGKCIDSLENAIPYVNISVKNRTYGTVTDANGLFVLDSEALKETDTLIISHLNFDKQLVPILNNNHIEIILKSTNIVLDEVVVTNRNRNVKQKVVGTKVKSDNVILSFVSSNLGSEVGKIIKVKKGKVYNLEKVFFNITNLEYNSVILRVNFYDIVDGIIDRNNKNSSEIIKKITGKGYVEIDLSDQYLSFDSDFLVSIEWINFEVKGEISSEERLFYISSTVFSGPFVSS